MNARNRLLQTVVVLWFAALGAPAGLAGNLPLPRGEARTPETRTLTAPEAAQALENDWLFPAMGEPLLERAAKEIGWARQLAARLARQAQALDLSAELKELDGLEQKLSEATPRISRKAEGKNLANISSSVQSGVYASPSWIWYPEG